MWQWKTYSSPKFTNWLVIGSVGFPCGSTLLNPVAAPCGIIGFSMRTLFGRSNGRLGTTGRKATIVSSRGLIRTVSFQPSSVGSGGMMMLSQVTRLISCTSKAWKWIGCVSTPLCVIFQIWVPSVARGDRSHVQVADRKPARVDELRVGFTYG